MVLEESSNPEDIFIRDDVPPADHESNKASITRKFTSSNLRTVSSARAETTPDELRIQYRVNGGPLRRYQIPFNRMPLQGFVRMLAFGDPRLTSHTSHSLIDLMSTMEAFNGRPLTQPEAEGVALHVSRRQLYTAAGTYLGITVGGLAAFSKRKTFKFPLRSPKPVEHYNMFPLQRAPLLTGQYARAAWHATRGLAYVALSWALIAPLYDYLGRTTQAVRLRRDDRTKNLAKEFSQSMKQARARSLKSPWQPLMGRGEGDISPGSDTVFSASDSSQPDPDSSRFGSYYSGTQDKYVQDNISSGSSSRYPYSDGASSTGVLSDGQSEFPVRSQYPSSPSGRRNRNSFRREKASQQAPASDSQDTPPDDTTSSLLPFPDDETSPAAGHDQSSISPSPSASSGSAWARLRESASSNTSPYRRTDSNPSLAPETPDADNKNGITPRHRRQSRARSISARQPPPSATDENEASVDSFSFSQDVQDSQLAKAQAQKEFDRMVEAERRGGGEETAGRGQESSWARRRGS